jgi:hypothetical protein
MECVSQLIGAFLTFAPEMLDLSGGPLFRRRARAWIIGVLRTGFRGLRGDRPLCVPWIAPACEGAMSFPRSQCISTRFLESPGVHFGHLVHQTFKNENTLREDCMRRSCSCIQKRFRKFWPERQAVPNGVNGERRMHHRLSDAVVEAILTGGARCAPATPRSRFSVASSAAVRTSRDPTARRGKARRA